MKKKVWDTGIIRFVEHCMFFLLRLNFVLPFLKGGKGWNCRLLMFSDFGVLFFFFVKIHVEYGALRKLSDEAAHDSSSSAPQDQPDKVATSSEVLALPGILVAIF